MEHPQETAPEAEAQGYVKMMASGAQYQILECGLLRPLGYEPCDQLRAGQVGYLTALPSSVYTPQ